MEHGFFHPSRGYWQTTGEPSVEILAAYPEGTTEVPLRPSANHHWQDGEWTFVEPARNIRAEIAELEAQQTPRRIREAALTESGRDWLQSLETQIAALRAQL